MEEEVTPLSDNPVREPFNMNDPYGEMQKALDTLRGVVDAKPFITQLAEDTAKDGLRDARLALLAFENLLVRVRRFIHYTEIIAGKKGIERSPHLKVSLDQLQRMFPQELPPLDEYDPESVI